MTETILNRFLLFLFFEASSPLNNFLRTVYEIDKSVYDAQAIRSFYNQSSARLKKIEEIIKLAAK